MAAKPAAPVNAAAFFPTGDAVPKAEAASLSQMARGMQGSKILQIAADVAAQVAAGKAIADFTVGDFARTEFRVPEILVKYTSEYLAAGETSYPPSEGVMALRKAVQAQALREMGLDYPLESFIIAAGARPVLYGAYRCLIDPGEKVVYPAPSWNNKNFCQLVGGVPVTVPTTPGSNFMPEVDALRAALKGARLLVLCSPGNPTGTMIREAQMRAICEAIVEENRRREAAGERVIFLIYDQVYRNLVFGDVPHVTPVGVMPEMAAYTVFVDAISKCFAATGLRVGWMYGPPHVARQMKSLMTHVGAWAPRAEQYAAARLIDDEAEMKAFLTRHKGGIHARLHGLADGLSTLKAEGLPVDFIAPEGAIYLSVKIDLEGRTGKLHLPDEDAVRAHLLEQAGCAVVPFSAFGDSLNRGWWRFSVGAVSEQQIHDAIPRLRAAIRQVV